MVTANNFGREQMRAMMMILVLVLGQLATAGDREPLIRLSVEKANIMLFEPIYLKMEKLSGSLPGFDFGAVTWKAESIWSKGYRL